MRGRDARRLTNLVAEAGMPEVFVPRGIARRPRVTRPGRIYRVHGEVVGEQAWPRA